MTSYTMSAHKIFAIIRENGVTPVTRVVGNDNDYPLPSFRRLEESPAYQATSYLKLDLPESIVTETEDYRARNVVDIPGYIGRALFLCNFMHQAGTGQLIQMRGTEKGDVLIVTDLNIPC